MNKLHKVQFYAIHMYIYARNALHFRFASLQVARARSSMPQLLETATLKIFVNNSCKGIS